MISRHVYTYYEPIDKIDRDNQEDLIKICAKSWKQNGWEFIVLNYEKAKEHKFYLTYSEIIKKLPSINPHSYDYHCYMRWLAMSQIGGGLMIDYDVVNTNFKYEDSMLLIDNKKLTVLQDHVPCAVYGSSEQYLAICQKFCELIYNPKCIIEINNQPHTSDMIMIAIEFSEKDINKLKYVVDYPNTAPLIHCSNRFCAENNKNKLEAMSEIIIDKNKM
jgi:hypothetical protein